MQSARPGVLVRRFGRLLIMVSVVTLGACGGSGTRVAADAGASADANEGVEPPHAPADDDVTPSDAHVGSAGAPAAEEQLVSAEEQSVIVDENDVIEPDRGPAVGRGRESAYRTQAGIASCSREDILSRVDFDMRDYYLYRDRVPTLSLDNMQTPELLMEALRVAPDVYSFVGDSNRIEQLRELGLAQGFGFWFQPHDGDSGVHFREVLLGSPAHRVGIQRGDRLLRINARDIDTYDDASLQLALQADAVEFQVQTGSDTPRDVILDVAEYRWTTARSATLIDRGASDLRIGYLAVRRFLGTTSEEIDESLRSFASDGIDELILDLRYNPGGRSDVALRLAGQIGGEAVVGQVYQRLQANDRYPDDGFDMLFKREPHRLNISRVVVLTSSFSASATEALINGLQPWLDVTVVGERTEGKPFSSYTEHYCGKSIDAMSLIRSNATGQSVTGGIEPDCAVADQWYFPADDTDNDALLKAGIHFVETGACSSSKEAGPRDVVSFPRRDGKSPPDYRAMTSEQLRSEDILAH